ncbi:MAG: hypothetical protein JST33_03970 [Actinobacteria bacterium]|nr:hypothetical protein [Actinomycetota bacterium]
MDSAAQILAEIAGELQRATELSSVAGQLADELAQLRGIGVSDDESARVTVDRNGIVIDVALTDKALAHGGEHASALVREATSRAIEHVQIQAQPIRDAILQPHLTAPRADLGGKLAQREAEYAQATARGRAAQRLKERMDAGGVRVSSARNEVTVTLAASGLLQELRISDRGTALGGAGLSRMINATLRQESRMQQIDCERGDESLDRPSPGGPQRGKGQAEVGSGGGGIYETELGQRIGQRHPDRIGLHSICVRVHVGHLEGVAHEPSGVELVRARRPIDGVGDADRPDRVAVPVSQRGFADLLSRWRGRVAPGPAGALDVRLQCAALFLCRFALASAEHHDGKPNPR